MVLYQAAQYVAVSRPDPKLADNLFVASFVCMVIVILVGRKSEGALTAICAVLAAAAVITGILGFYFWHGGTS